MKKIIVLIFILVFSSTSFAKRKNPCSKNNEKVVSCKKIKNAKRGFFCSKQKLTKKKIEAICKADKKKKRKNKTKKKK